MELKTAIIFGASRGIGSSILRHFQQLNWPVTAVSRTQGDFKADISDPIAVAQAFAFHKNKFKVPPFCVVNCAAIQAPMGALWDAPVEQIEKNLNINLLGSVWVAREAILQMKKGSIILLGGGGAVAARPMLTSYSIAKTAVLRLVENLDAELKERGRKDLVINALAPGAVATEMMQELVTLGASLPAREVEAAQATLASGGTPMEKIHQLIDFLVDEKRHHGLSGRLIHVREPYEKFVQEHKGDFPVEAGKLIRKGL